MAQNRREVQLNNTSHPNYEPCIWVGASCQCSSAGLFDWYRFMNTKLIVTYGNFIFLSLYYDEMAQSQVFKLGLDYHGVAL